MFSHYFTPSDHLCLSGFMVLLGVDSFNKINKFTFSHISAFKTTKGMIPTLKFDVMGI